MNWTTNGVLNWKSNGNPKRSIEREGENYNHQPRIRQSSNVINIFNWSNHSGRLGWNRCREFRACVALIRFWHFGESKMNLRNKTFNSSGQLSPGAAGWTGKRDEQERVECIIMKLNYGEPPPCHCSRHQAVRFEQDSRVCHGWINAAVDCVTLHLSKMLNRLPNPSRTPINWFVIC